jgi:hypothetical protein
VFFTLDRKAFIDMVVFFQKIEELPPHFFAFTSIQKGVGVSNHDQTIASPRKQDVNSLRCRHETDVI